MNANQTYQQLRGFSISDAVSAFDKIDVSDPSVGDEYFEKFGVGNVIPHASLAFERFSSYEFLLQEMQQHNGTKYQEIHKGTAFYFLAWTAFDIADYEKAVYYLDSAFTEDVRKSKTLGEKDVVRAALENPGGYLIRLVPEKSGPASRITNNLKENFEKQLHIFNKNSSLNVTTEQFVENFVSVIVRDSEYRSLVTAIYTYIFEFEDRYKMLEISQNQKGSLEPWVIHLFKGGLIFETLLKYVAKKHGLGDLKTIGNFSHSKKFQSLYCDFIETKDKSLDISGLSKLPHEMRNSFRVSYSLRNSTGHDLRRTDTLNPAVYKRAIEHELFAIFYVIYKEFVEKSKKGEVGI